MLPCPKAMQYGRDTHQATASASPLTRPYTRLTTPAEAAHETLGLVQDIEQEILLLTAPPGPTSSHPATSANGPNSGVQKAQTGPWWQFWRAF